MSAAFDVSLIRFSLVNGVLACLNGDSGDSDVSDDIDTQLTRVDPEEAKDEEPCLAIPQANNFALRLPGASECLHINDQIDETLIVQVFWALDENQNVVLIVYNNHFQSGVNEFIALSESKNWQAMPSRGQLYRRFARAKDAYEQFPDDEVVIKVIGPQNSNHWILDYHNTGGTEPGGGDLRASPELLTAMDLTEFATAFSHRHYRRAGYTTFPNLPKEMRDMLVVAFGHSQYGAMVIMLQETGEDAEKRSFVRYHRLTYTFEEYQQLLAPSA